MNPNKALWEKGDFTRIAASMRESGEALFAGLGITDQGKVYCVGLGKNGNAFHSYAVVARPRPEQKTGQESAPTAAAQSGVGGDDIPF